MRVQDILKTKGPEVFKVWPSTNLFDAVKKLVACNCGSLVVCEEQNDSQVIGIITERDILRVSARTNASMVEMSVSDAMSVDVYTITPEVTVEETMGQMTSRRIRHVPVLENGKLVGIISIGDVVKAQHAALTMENHYLKNYLHEA